MRKERGKPRMLLWGDSAQGKGEGKRMRDAGLVA